MPADVLDSVEAGGAEAGRGALRSGREGVSRGELELTGGGGVLGLQGCCCRGTKDISGLWGVQGAAMSEEKDSSAAAAALALSVRDCSSDDWSHSETDTDEPLWLSVRRLLPAAAAAAAEAARNESVGSEGVRLVSCFGSALSSCRGTVLAVPFKRPKEPPEAKESSCRAAAAAAEGGAHAMDEGVSISTATLGV